MSSQYPRIVVTSGEPAGIGPDICCLLALSAVPARMAFAADPDVIRTRARQLNANIELKICEHPKEFAPHHPGSMQLLPTRTANPVTPGRLDPANSPYVLEMLHTAAKLCLAGDCDAIVTAPVHKSVINDSGFAFTGHTEYLAQLTAVTQPVMMLASPTLKVALATTHLPLRDVADAISEAGLERLLRTIDLELRTKFRMTKPRMLVLGLNPHAGENGVLGQEEQTVLEPVIRRLTLQGLNIRGPVPADTAFTPEQLDETDIVVAMYHDQGLPVLKATSFGEIVNITLGLPIIRTSVDHGTALKLAGTGRARPESLRAAVNMAIDIAGRTRK